MILALPPYPSSLIFVMLAAGLCLGSFAATAALRAARNESPLKGRSRCEGCGSMLRFSHTVPVVSYLWLRGACGACKARIDPLHTLGEILGASIVLACLFATPPVRAAAMGLLGLALLGSSVIDLKSRRLPDLLTLSVALLAGVLSWLAEGWSGLTEGLAFAAGAYAILWLVRRRHHATKGDHGLGMGDVKLISALAIWLGPATALMVAAASAFALMAVWLLKPQDPRLPFGPFIAATGFIAGLAREYLSWP